MKVIQNTPFGGGGSPIVMAGQGVLSVSGQSRNDKSAPGVSGNDDNRRVKTVLRRIRRWLPSGLKRKVKSSKPSDGSAQQEQPEPAKLDEEGQEPKEPTVEVPEAQRTENEVVQEQKDGVVARLDLQQAILPEPVTFDQLSRQVTKRGLDRHPIRAGQPNPFTIHIANRKDAIARALEEEATMTLGEWSFWPDGSALTWNKSGTGGAAVAYRGDSGQWAVEAYHIEGLRSHAEHENVALVMALDIATQEIEGVEILPSVIRIFTDSDRALQTMRTHELKTPHAQTELGKLGTAYGRKLSDMGISIELHWVPGHTGVRGNEIADHWSRAALWWAQDRHTNGRNDFVITRLRIEESQERWVLSQPMKPLKKKRKKGGAPSKHVEHE